MEGCYLRVSLLFQYYASFTQRLLSPVSCTFHRDVFHVFTRCWRIYSAVGYSARPHSQFEYLAENAYSSGKIPTYKMLHFDF